MEEIRPHIEKIHATPHKAVVAVSGAGTQAVAWLLGVAGASRTILEALVPYGRESMRAFLGFEPKQSASAQTAKDMSESAYKQAKSQLEDDSPPVGLACAATIATDRPKRGDHRAYVSAWDQSGNTLYSLKLHKGLRDRAGEEELVSNLLVHALMALSGLESAVDLGLTPGDTLEIERAEHGSPFEQLLCGEAGWVSVRGGFFSVEGEIPDGLLPGSFSPLHQGHRGLAQAAAIPNLLEHRAVDLAALANHGNLPIGLGFPQCEEQFGTVIAISAKPTEFRVEITPVLVRDLSR